MKLIEFPEQTLIIAEDQKEYLPLPAYVFRNTEGEIVCCWKLTWRERIKILFSGILWHHVLTFGQALQPLQLSTEKPDMPKQ